MAQPSVPCPSLRVSKDVLGLVRKRSKLRLSLLHIAVLISSVSSSAQSAQQQYVYGSVPVSTSASQVVAYSKAAQSGALSAVAGSPFSDALLGGAMAIDGQGHFLFVVNASTSNISMFQINSSTGSLAEVPGSPFSTGPTENPNMAATGPVCLSAEKSGQFLYVGYRFGNFANQAAVNEFLIDQARQQLVPLAVQATTDIRSSPIGMVSDPKGVHLYVGLGLNLSTGVQDAGTNVYSIDPVTGQIVFAGNAGNALFAGRSIAIDPQGRFFFDGWGTTSGGIDSALISPADGTAITGISTVNLAAGQIPAAMLADGSGKFLYVQQGSGSVVYSINQTTGALMVPATPLSVLSFNITSAAADPLGPYIYSLQTDGIHGFLIDPQTGSLSEVPGSPFGGALAQGALAISGSPVQALSGPVAALFPASENFGAVTVGQSSNSQLVTLTNAGDQGLSINSISLGGANPGDFAATPNCTVPTVLAPNATCTVSVRFLPAAAGTRQANLLTTDNAPGSPQSLPLSGTGVAAQPAVTLVPASLLFPTTTQGSTSAAQTITVTSAGTATLHISSVLPGGANPGDFQVTNNCAGAYAVNSNCTISVTFSPLGAAQRTATVTITDDAPDSPQSVQLTGNGADPTPGTPAVKVTLMSISFGTVTQGAAVGAHTVTLTSFGTASLHISSIVLGSANSGDFGLVNNCTAAAYAVNASCTISVSFTPLSTGGRAALVTVTDDTPNSPQTIAISATVSAAFVISPASPGGNSVTVTAGQTAAFTLQITPAAGFAGSASFACAGVPPAATCTAPAVPITGSAPVSYVVSVATTASTMVVTRPAAPQGPPFATLRAISTLASCAMLLLLFLFFRARRFSAQTPLLSATPLAALALICFFGVAACGGGSAAAPQSVPTPHVTGTPQGTSTITLTPSASTSSGTALPGIPPIQLTLTVK